MAIIRGVPNTVEGMCEMVSKPTIPSIWHTPDRAVCTGCFRRHSHEIVVPLQRFGCLSQPTCYGVQPSTTTIQPGYDRSTTKVQPQRIAAARIARACLVLWL